MIACLGWGSLVWDQRDLPIRDAWRTDGPSVRVDFLRQSTDDRITLVLNPDSAPVPSLWAIMASDTLQAAMAALAAREGTPVRNIGVWGARDRDPPLIPALAQWANEHGADHVIWTNLAPKFHGQNVTPSAEQVVTHLDGLHGAARDRAERYVRSAPRQIDTNYRRQIAARLGWNPL
jgi:hypothetical protein